MCPWDRYRRFAHPTFLHLHFHFHSISLQYTLPYPALKIFISSGSFIYSPLRSLTHYTLSLTTLLRSLHSFTHYSRYQNPSRQATFKVTMKALNPLLLLIAATAFCVSADDPIARSLSAALQSTSTVDTPVATPTSSSQLIPTICPSTNETCYNLPFEIQLGDMCLSGERSMDGVYMSGNISQIFIMSADGTFELDPKANGYQNLTFGPFNPKLGLLRVEYQGSNWSDTECDQMWRFQHVAAEGCVHCNAGNWSAPPLDCSITNTTTLPFRNTTLSCAVLLGKPSITPTVTSTFTPMTTPSITPIATGGAKGLLDKRITSTPPTTETFLTYSYTTYSPLLYTTSVPSPDNPKVNWTHSVVPFDIRMLESCNSTNQKVLALAYTSGSYLTQNLPNVLYEGRAPLTVDMKVPPGTHFLKLVPFNSDTGFLTVGYEGSSYSTTQCEDYNNVYKYVDTCVYCNRSAVWEGEPVDCHNFKIWRYRKMYCELYLAPEKVY